ncbi:hypothetical protein E2562_012889 [Oryza meyeriana var. granulata]|uniref:Uncharacterized protein n=1 Tax=Oryza meyeriana var. granulata TaxID=110450 RepID=A0A6G1CEI5_9ORYZ|nr:hypothetical protein E2562_012889 [Oryza meyeriana var. granulata]
MLLSYIENNIGRTIRFATCWAMIVVYGGTVLSDLSIDGAPLARLAETSVVGVRAWTKRVTSIVFAINASQDVTPFTKQGSTMDRSVGDTSGASSCHSPHCSSLPLVSPSSTLLLIYNHAIVPHCRFTKHLVGITML